MPPHDLRASDADRDRAAAALREAGSDGRLTLDELEERLGQTYAARTISELHGLLADLATAPAETLAGPAPQPSPPGRRRRVYPGRIGFSERVPLRAPPERCRTQALEHIAPLLARWDYRLVARGPDHLGFELDQRPLWTIVVAVFAFPLGLLALTVKRRERIDLEFAPAPGGGTSLLVAGKAPRAIRRAFLELRD